MPGGANPSFMVASNGPVGSPRGAVSANPFRNAPSDSDSTPAATTTTAPTGVLAGTGLIASNPFSGSTLGSSLATGSPLAAAPAVQTDPMIADLDTRIEAIKMQIAPFISGTTTLQLRSGAAGGELLAGGRQPPRIVRTIASIPKQIRSQQHVNRAP